MNKLKQLVENLAKKAGIDITDVEFAKTLELIKDIEVSEEIAVKLESNLYDLESAKQNYNLKSHFTALALNGVDAQLKDALDEFIEDEAVRNELLSVKSTPARVKSALTKIRELESAKAKHEGKGDDGKAKKAQEEIDKLIAEFKTKEATYLSQIAEKEKEKTEAISTFKEELFYGGLKYANDFDLETNLLVAKQKINKALAEKGAKKIYNPTTGKFDMKRADDESLDYLDERNNKTSYEDFAKEILSQNKLLAVTDSTATQHTQPFVLHTTNGNHTVDTSAYDALQIP